MKTLTLAHFFILNFTIYYQYNDLILKHIEFYSSYCASISFYTPTNGFCSCFEVLLLVQR